MLSYSQASVEQGFSVNKQTEATYSTGDIFEAKQLVFDHIALVGTKTVLLEIAIETIGCIKPQKKWISDETIAAIGEKKEAKGKDKAKMCHLVMSL